MEQRADDVVGIHTADALDVRAGARLAVRDDGQRLECGRREARFLPRGVGGEPRADLRCGDQLPGAVVVLDAQPAAVFVEVFWRES